MSSLQPYYIGAMTAPSHRDLLAAGTGPEPTRLAADPAAAALSERGGEQLMDVVCQHPGSSLGWALLAEDSLAVHSREADVAAYAYARTGYHRGLDALRRAGWRGSGPIPWEHEPNRGFLRALHALSVAAERIGDTAEQERCAQFLRDSSETAYLTLTGQSTG
jgi:Protein of unknown function (DUF3151)